MSSPILDYSPGGGVPIWTPPPPTPGHAPPQEGITFLTVGQSYVDVVFPTGQAHTDWTFIELQVLNTTDASPLNIWPGIVTSKTKTGFRLYLNGLPDSMNYYLDWSITGATIASAGTATTYLFSGPATGPLGSPTTFVVALPTATIMDDGVVITPNDGGAGGVFSPVSVTLSTGTTMANFTYTPASYGTKTLSVTNDSGLSDPASLSFSAVATTYTLIGPSSGTVGVASTNFTVALPVGGAVAGTVIVTPHDSGLGGTFTPSTVNLTTGSPSATFTYTAASTGARTISVTNSGGLTDPVSLTYSVGLADGSLVSTWPDSSVNGNNATMTGSNRPTFKTNIVNGHPVVRFTSAGQSKLNLTTPISGALPWWIFAVMKQATGGRIDSLDGNAASGTPLGLTIVTGNTVLVFTRDGYIGNLAGPLSAGFHVLEGIHASVGGEFIVIDGTNDSSTLTASPNSGNFVSIGYDSITPTYCDGDIAEIIIYNAMTTPSRLNLEAYLGTKFGIAVAGGGTAVDPSTVAGLVGWWKADSLG